MSETWSEQLYHLLYTLDENRIGADRLSQAQLNQIHTSIIKPFNLSTKKLQKQILDDESPTIKDTAFFVLETSILIEDIVVDNQQYFDQLCSIVISSLKIPKKNWNWIVDSNIYGKDYYYYRLRLLCTLIYKLAVYRTDINQAQILDLLATLSCHIHPKLPWTSKLNSELIKVFIENNFEVRQMIYSLVPSYINEKLKPELLDLSHRKKMHINSSLSNPKLTPAGYAITKRDGNESLDGGLRPRLGYGGTNIEIIEEDQRQNWKLSTKVKSISMIWFMIYTISDNEYIDQFWPIITSFILNLIDDPDPLMKAQSCELLNYLMIKIHNGNGHYKNHILVKTGLSGLLTESCKTCLSYLPNLTPSDQSQYLLSIAYPTIFRLCALKCEQEGNCLSFVELINVNILASIAHIYDRNGHNSHYQLICFLLNQLDTTIKDYLKTNVLVCFSRINFTLNQIMINPYILEDGNEGLDCIISALTVQKNIFQAFQYLSDIESIKLVLNYKYDFLAIWAVLKKRSKLNLSENSRTEILKFCDFNFKLVRQLTIDCGQDEFETLQNDVKLILLINSDLHSPLD